MNLHHSAPKVSTPLIPSNLVHVVELRPQRVVLSRGSCGGAVALVEASATHACSQDTDVTAVQLATMI